MTKIIASNPQSKSADHVEKKLVDLRAILPDALREATLDSDGLNQLLGQAVEASPENYRLDGHGKRQPRQVALTPSTGTLRPSSEKNLDRNRTL